MRKSDSLSRLGFAAAIVAGALSLSVVALFAHDRAAADEPNRAGIVVTFGEGRSNALCVEFEEPEISGAELLQRAGFPVVTATGSGGAAVCSIGGMGCEDPGDCFCECHGSGCQYWAYYTLDGGAWKYSAVGSSTRKVRNGDVDGWAWGSGSIGSGAKPELHTFDEICPPVAASTPPPPPVSTPPPTIALEPTSEVAAAMAPPPATVTVEFKPAATATTRAPTDRPTDPSPTKVAPATKDDDQSGFPWQLPAFAFVAAGLLGTAVALANRRVRGKRG